MKTGLRTLLNMKRKKMESNSIFFLFFISVTDSHAIPTRKANFSMARNRDAGGVASGETPINKFQIPNISIAGWQIPKA